MNNRRYYQIAGMTIQVDADLPFTDATFDPKFRVFQVAEPGNDVVRIRHHFSFPTLNMEDLGNVVYRRVPWAIYKRDGGWVYLGISPDLQERPLWTIATFNERFTDGDIYFASENFFSRGNSASLTFFPTDQILLTQLLAHRQACYLHSSAVIMDGQGLVFVAHSEGGKSTTVKMLQSRAEILCDDRNIVRRWPEGFRVYGSWSHGEVPDVSAASAPLRAILFLEQARENRLVRIEDRKDILHRLVVCVIKSLVTTDWWDKIFPLLEEMAAQVPCYIMRFDKSGDIVQLLEGLCESPAPSVSIDVPSQFERVT